MKWVVITSLINSKICWVSIRIDLFCRDTVFEHSFFHRFVQFVFFGGMMIGIYLVLALVYFFIWPYSLIAVKQNALRGLGMLQHQRLPDLGHGLIPESRSREILSNLLAYGSILGFASYGWYFELSWFWKYLCYIALLQVFRCLCFNVTILPDCSQVAHEKSWFSKYFTGGEHDLIFSGHLSYLYAPLWFGYKFHVISAGWYFASLGVVAIEFCLILASRTHYTIDLLMAIASSHFILDLVHN